MNNLVLDQSQGRTPQQRRSRETLARLLKAAESLFSERGYNGTTVANIVSRARCSVGSFYARFTGKESLLLYLHDRESETLIQRVEFLRDLARAENAGLEKIVQQTVRTVFAYSGKNRELSRLFIQQAMSDPKFHKKCAENWATAKSMLCSAILSRRTEINHADPDRATSQVLQIIHAAWTDDVLNHPVRTIIGHRYDDALIEETTALCLALLRGPSD